MLSISTNTKADTAAYSAPNSGIDPCADPEPCTNSGAGVRPDATANASAIAAADSGAHAGADADNAHQFEPAVRWRQ